MKISQLSDQVNIFLSWQSGTKSDMSILSPGEKNIAEEISHPLRKTQFILGRVAAREALNAAGCMQDFEILRGGRGEPLIPPGYCCSVSHCRAFIESENEYCIALAGAAEREKFTSIGIDIESIDRLLQQGIEKRVCSDKEAEWALQKETSLRLLMLVSAKEALYKMIYPLCGVFFGLTDAELTWNNETSEFSAVLLKNLDNVYTAGSKYNIKVFTKDNILISLATIR